MDDYCAVCKDDGGFLFECEHCGFAFCDEHQDPTAHRCPALDDETTDDGRVDAARSAVATARDRAGALRERAGTLPETLRDRADAVRARASATRERAAGKRERVAGTARARLAAIRDRAPGVRDRAGTDSDSGAARGRASAVRDAVARRLDGVRGARSSARARLAALRERLGARTWRPWGRADGDRSGERTARGPTGQTDGGAVERVRSSLGRLRATVSGARAAIAAQTSRSRLEPPRKASILAVFLIVVALGIGTGATLAPSMDSTAQTGGQDGPTGAAAPTADVEQQSPEAAILAAVDDARENASAPALEYDPTVEWIASDHSRELAAAGAGNASTVDWNVSAQFAEHEHDCARVGATTLWVEGVDRDDPERLADAVVEQWLDSEAHASFLLSEEYDRAAVGVASGDDDRLYVSLTACGVDAGQASDDA